jgi:hypothetical protein
MVNPGSGCSNCPYSGKKTLFDPHFVTSKTTVNYSSRFELTMRFALCCDFFRLKSTLYDISCPLLFVNTFVLYCFKVERVAKCVVSYPACPGSLSPAIGPGARHYASGGASAGFLTGREDILTQMGESAASGGKPQAVGHALLSLRHLALGRDARCKTFRASMRSIAMEAAGKGDQPWQ